MQGPIRDARQTAPLWRVEMLGGLRVVGMDREITRFSAGKARGLLARLACGLHRQHPREELVELLWPDCDPRAARLRLRVAVNNLRTELEPAPVRAGSVLIAEGDMLRLNPETVSTDVSEFEAALDATEERGARLAHAIGLYRGDLLPGLYDDWALLERERLARRWLHAVRELSHVEADAGRIERAIDLLHRAVAAAPDDESCRRDLELVTADAGRTSEDAAHGWRLADAPRTEPGARQEPASHSAVAVSPVPAPLRKPSNPDVQSAPPQAASGLSAQQPHDPFDPLSALRPAQSRPVLLPLTLTRFFGRETELDEIERLLTGSGVERSLSGNTVRLLSLTGPGGVGKTQLAIEAGRRLAREFPGGTVFVPLADVRQSATVAEAILRALAFPILATRPALEQAIEALNPPGACMPTLLILDNLEHLVSAHGGSAALVVHALLEGAPHLTVLCTSRQPIGLHGERELPLDPLTTPLTSATPDRLLEFPSVMLYADRAQAVRPGFRVTPTNAAAVASLCTQLDGLPLALELAAAWARVLSPSQMLARMERRFTLLVSRQLADSGRHASLQATMEWSYDLLSAQQRELFVRLSVFYGGCTLEALETVAADPMDRARPERRDAAKDAPDIPLRRDDVLPILSQLVERSLVIADERGAAMRYRMLESVREFAVSVHTPDARELLLRRHAEWCLEMAERGPAADRAAWLSEMDAERANIRGAIEWCIDADTRAPADEINAAGAPPANPPHAHASLQTAAARTLSHRRMAVRLVRAASDFWRTRGYAREAAELCDRLLSRLVTSGATYERAVVLNIAATLAQAMGDSARATTLLQEAIALYRECGNPDGASAAHHNLAIAHKAMGQYDAAVQACQEALAMNQEAGALPRLAGNLSLLGTIAHERAEYAAAREYYDQALALDRAIGDREAEATVLGNLANILHEAGDLARAEALHRSALNVYRELGHREGQARTLSNLGGLALAAGDPARAADLYRQARAVYTEIGDRRGEAESLSNFAWTLYEQQDYDAARQALETAIAEMQAAGHRRGVATGLNKLGCVLQKLGAYDRACACQRASLEMRMAAGIRQGAIYCLLDMASLALAQGDAERCVVLFGAAAAARAAIGWLPPPGECTGYDADLTRARAALDESQFARAWGYGHALDLDSAAAFALRGADEQT